MAYGLPSPTPYHHRKWYLEMPSMHPAPLPTLNSNTTPSPSFTHSRFRLWFKKKRTSLAITKPCFRTTQRKIKYMYLQTLPSGPTPTCTPITRGQGLKTKSSTCFTMGGLGPWLRRFSSSGFFLDFFLWGLVLADLPPLLEWTSFPPLVTAVLIKFKGAESRGSRRIGVIGVLVYFLPSETVWDKFSFP